MSRLVFEKKLPCGVFQTWDGPPPFDCFHVHQVHGVNFLSEGQNGQADGIFGKQEKPWAIKTADCLPVVVWGKNGFVFFHAGWRGIADQIHLSNYLNEISPIGAFIGPCISATKFEVSNDFTQHFPGSENFLDHTGDKKLFDLTAELTQGLQKAYPNITVDNSSQCTFTNTDFHSYRQNKTTLRNWNVFTSNELTHYNK